MSNQNAKGKLKYEAPVLVALGGIDTGIGDCTAPGTAPASLCSAGTNASGTAPGYCQAGTVASPGYCTAGTTAATACTSTGNSAVTACTAGTLF